MWLVWPEGGAEPHPEPGQAGPNPEPCQVGQAVPVRDPALARIRSAQLAAAIASRSSLPGHPHRDRHPAAVPVR
jgi:hypothetical protein